MPRIRPGGPSTAVDPGAYVTQEEFDEQGPSGRELAYASTTGSFDPGASVIDVTGASVTFTVAGRPVIVEAQTPYSGHSVEAAGLTLYITDEANVVKAGAGVGSGGANQYGTLTVRERISTPGTYTRKLRSDATTAGGFLNIFSLGRIEMWAVES